MAAAAAVLDVLKQQELQRHALQVGNDVCERVTALARRHALVGDASGAGWLLGVELVADRVTRAPATAEAARVVNGLRERQVLLSTSGKHANVLKIRLPLVFTMANADLLVQRLDEVVTGNRK